MVSGVVDWQRSNAAKLITELSPFDDLLPKGQNVPPNLTLVQPALARDQSPFVAIEPENMPTTTLVGENVAIVNSIVVNLTNGVYPHVVAAAVSSVHRVNPNAQVIATSGEYFGRPGDPSYKAKQKELAASWGIPEGNIILVYADAGTWMQDQWLEGGRGTGLVKPAEPFYQTGGRDLQRTPWAANEVADDLGLPVYTSTIIGRGGDSHVITKDDGSQVFAFGLETLKYVMRSYGLDQDSDQERLRAVAIAMKEARSLGISNVAFLGYRPDGDRKTYGDVINSLTEEERMSIDQESMNQLIAMKDLVFPKFSEYHLDTYATFLPGKGNNVIFKQDENSETYIAALHHHGFSPLAYALPAEKTATADNYIALSYANAITGVHPDGRPLVILPSKTADPNQPTANDTYMVDLMRKLVPGAIVELAGKETAFYASLGKLPSSGLPVVNLNYGIHCVGNVMSRQFVPVEAEDAASPQRSPTGLQIGDLLWNDVFGSDTDIIQGSFGEDPIGGSLSDALLSSTSLTQSVHPAPGDALGHEIVNAVAAGNQKTLFKNTPFGNTLSVLDRVSGPIASILMRTGNVTEGQILGVVPPLVDVANLIARTIRDEPVSPFEMGTALFSLAGLFGNEETKKFAADAQRVIGTGEAVLNAIKVNSLPADQLAKLGPNAAAASIVGAGTAIFNLIGPMLGASGDVMKWGNILLSGVSLALAPTPIGAAMLVYQLLDVTGVIKKPTEIRFLTKIDTTGDGTADKTNLLLDGGFKYMPWDAAKDLQFREARVRVHAPEGYVDPADGTWKPTSQYKLEGRDPPPGVGMSRQFYMDGWVGMGDFNPYSDGDWHHFGGITRDSLAKRGPDGEILYTADDWNTGLIQLTEEQYNQIAPLDPKGNGVTLDPSHPVVQIYKDRMLAAIPPGELTFVQHGMNPGLVTTPRINGDGHREILQQFLSVEIGDKKIGDGDGSFKLTVGGPWDAEFAMTGTNSGELASIVRTGPLFLELVASDPKLMEAYRAAEQSESPDKGAATLFRQLVDMAPEDRPAKTFDWTKYAAQNPDVYRAFDGNPWLIIQHYITAGADEGRKTVPDDPIKAELASSMMKNPDFTAEYAASNPDDLGKLYASGEMDQQDLVMHFLEHGYDEGRVNWEFDAVAYLAQNTDVLASLGGFDRQGAVKHYLTYGKNEGRKLAPDDAGVTDSLRTLLGDGDAALAYVAGQPDLFANGNLNLEKDDPRQIAAMDFAMKGQFAEVMPKIFDIDAYLVSNLDVLTATNGNRTEALKHYITYGHAEHRNATIDNDAERLGVAMMNSEVRKVEYLMANPDVAAAVGNDLNAGFEHFLRAGQFEGRTADMSAAAYRLLNPDLIKAGLGPIEAGKHFLTNGMTEGRATGPRNDTDRMVLQIARSRDNAIRYLVGNRLYENPEIGTSLSKAIDHLAVNRPQNPAMFDENAYLLRRPDLVDTIGFGLPDLATDFMRSGSREPGADAPVDPETLAMLRRLRSSPQEAYAMMASNGDLGAAFKDDPAGLIRHFIQHGQFEKRGITFNDDDYARANPDVTRAVLNEKGVGSYAEYHVKYGAAEGRLTAPKAASDPGSFLPAGFDAFSYLASNLDVLDAAEAQVPAGSDLATRAETLENFAEIHYLNAGAGEGRSLDTFDEVAYGAAHPEAMQNPLVTLLGGDTTPYYVLFGRNGAPPVA